MQFIFFSWLERQLNLIGIVFFNFLEKIMFTSWNIMEQFSKLYNVWKRGTFKKDMVKVYFSASIKLICYSFIHSIYFLFNNRLSVCLWNQFFAMGFPSISKLWSYRFLYFTFFFSFYIFLYLNEGYANYFRCTNFREQADFCQFCQFSLLFLLPNLFFAKDEKKLYE